MTPNNPAKSYGMRLLRQLLLHGKLIFDVKDVVAAASLEKIPSTQLGNILSILSKQGHISRLRRGLYLIIEMVSPDNTPHPFLIAIHLVQPSAISHWSALQYHGLTEQIPQIITASTPTKVVTPSMRESKPRPSKLKHIWKIAGISYEYIQVKREHFFGIEKIWIDTNSQVLITDKERTLLDVFIYQKMFGGMGESLGILENALATIDVKKLVSYTIQYNQKGLAKRLGWALSYFDVPEKKLEPLLKMPIHHFCRLDPSAPAVGPCDKRWMIQNNLIKSDK